MKAKLFLIIFSIIFLVTFAFVKANASYTPDVEAPIEHPVDWWLL